MIKQIANEKRLKGNTTYVISDAGMTIAVDDDLNKDSYIAVKVDDYYNGLHLQGETPKAVDYIVSVDCRCDAYVLYILELKNTARPSFTTKSIHEKFETAIYRFMGREFSYIYQNDRYKYKEIYLYIVSKAYMYGVNSGKYEQIKAIMEKTGRKDTLNRDRIMGEKPFFFRGKRLFIEKEFPPNPIISRIT